MLDTKMSEVDATLPSPNGLRPGGTGVGFSVENHQNGSQISIIGPDVVLASVPENSAERTPSARRNSKLARRKSRAAAKLLEREAEENKPPLRPTTPWQMFEDHLKNINDDTMTFTHSGGKSLEHTGSDIFQKVMGDINHKKRERELREQKRLEEAARRAEEGRQQEEKIEEDEEEEDLSDDDSEEEEEDVEKVQQVSKATKMAAQRGWAIIRRKIQELKLERQNNDAGNSWSFLRRTLKNMTNMEKAREELYEKYLYKPNSWMDGLTNLPHHILPSVKSSARQSSYSNNSNSNDHSAYGSRKSVNSVNSNNAGRSSNNGGRSSNNAGRNSNNAGRRTSMALRRK